MLKVASGFVGRLASRGSLPTVLQGNPTPSWLSVSGELRGWNGKTRVVVGTGCLLGLNVFIGRRAG